jgi:hypothetical protein
MSVNAYKRGREMVWSKTAEMYMRSFEMARRQVAATPCEALAASAFGRRPHESAELNVNRPYHI